MSCLFGRGCTKSPDFHLQHRFRHDALTDVNDVLKNSGKSLKSVVSILRFK